MVEDCRIGPVVGVAQQFEDCLISEVGAARDQRGDATRVLPYTARSRVHKAGPQRQSP
jgi:hypothetical protein